MKKNSNSNRGWTIKMKENRYPNLYSKSGYRKNGIYCGEYVKKQVEVSNDT